MNHYSNEAAAIAAALMVARFTVGLHGHRLFWSSPTRLWLGAGASAHFVPNHPDDTVFALFSVGLRGCDVPPWSSDEEREDGFTLGANALAIWMAGR